MTTTPDSRIRADWTLPAETAAPPPTVAPDTSTTRGRIAVMQAWVRDWRSVECLDKQKLGDKWEPVQEGSPDVVGEPAWNWDRYNYRIAPPPAPRSALQAARKHRSAWKGAHNPDSLHLEPLLREIDNSKTVNIVLDGKGIYHFEHDGIAPGRYRLVRDDAP